MTALMPQLSFHSRSPKGVMSLAVLVGVAFIAVGAYLAAKHPAEAPIKIQPAIGTMNPFIVVDSPQQGGIIASPLVITGKARGTWYFEASFPIILVDGRGRVIKETYAQAEGEWMTKDFVPFRMTIEFEAPDDGETFDWRGTLIFKKDNPSGLPENGDLVKIPVVFAH